MAVYRGRSVIAVQTNRHDELSPTCLLSAVCGMDLMWKFRAQEHRIS
jgi:hypothetical protein